MGFSFRRSVGAGPFRINFSTRGVGISTGVRGARLSVGPRGTYVTLGRGGFQYRKRIDGPGRRAPAAAPRPGPSAPALPSSAATTAPEEGAILTASATELAAVSPDATIEDAQKALRRTDFFKVFMWTAAAALLYAFAAFPQAGVIAIAVVLAVAAPFIYRWSRDRCTAAITYDLEDGEIALRAQLAAAIGEALSNTHRLWHVHYAVESGDKKRNAGADTLIERTATQSRRGSLPRIAVNVDTWCIPAGPQRLLFLPDRLIVWDGTTLAGVPYEDLIPDGETTQFIEEGPIPRDSEQVGTTWRYVNKSGGPDRRFNDNRSIPVLEYGRLTIESTTGLKVILQTSKAECAGAVAEALQALGERADERAGASEPPPNLVASPTPPSRPSNPGNDNMVRWARASLTVFRYLAAADRRITDDEVAYAQTTVENLFARGGEQVRMLSASFRDLPSDDATVRGALAELGTAPAAGRQALVEAAQGLVEADGKATPKERERLAQVVAALRAGRSQST